MTDNTTERKAQWQNYFGPLDSLYVGEYSVFVMSLKAYRARSTADMNYFNSIDISMVVVDGLG